jgi:hypothetical protein
VGGKSGRSGRVKCVMAVTKGRDERTNNCDGKENHDEKERRKERRAKSTADRLKSDSKSERKDVRMCSIKPIIDKWLTNVKRSL